MKGGIPGRPVGEFRVTENKMIFNPDIEVVTEKGIVKIPVDQIVKYWE